MAQVELLTTPEAAVQLRVSPRTLEDWRTSGKGPPFRKVGGWRVLYHVDDLADWLQATVRQSTTDPGALARS